jgi:hypothetical protein
MSQKCPSREIPGISPGIYSENRVSRCFENGFLLENAEKPPLRMRRGMFFEKIYSASSAFSVVKGAFSKLS